MARRRRPGSSISVNVNVDVELYEVLEEIHDDDLKKECERRGVYVNPKRVGADRPEASTDITVVQDWQDLESDLRAALLGGDRIHFDVVLLRMRTLAGVPYLMTAGLKKDGLTALN